MPRRKLTSLVSQVDKHFPHLTVGQTLEFAAAVRTPSRRVGGISRATHIKYAVKLVMALCGLTHTYNTKVGNEYIRGVSGGERKRVSIAEMMIAGSPLSAWDNRYALLTAGLLCLGLVHTDMNSN